MDNPELEPVAWMHIPHDDELETVITKHKRSLKIYKSYVPLYTAPPQPTKLFAPNLEAVLDAAGYIKKKEWQGLKDEVIWLEYQRLWPFHPAEEPALAKDIVKFASAIEAKLKAKNA